MRALALCALAACAPDGRDAPARGDVTVYARTRYAGTPLSGATVVFQDPDGSERQTSTVDGVASGLITAGGSVTLFDGRGAYLIDMYTDVQPETTLHFGPDGPASRAVTARMQLAGSPPPGAEEIFLASPCTPRFGLVGVFDERCGAAADLVLLAYHVDHTAGRYPTYELVGYLALPNHPIVDGGTIAFDASAWKPLERVPATLVASRIDPATIGFGIITTMGHASAVASWEPPRAVAMLPPIGPVVLTADLADGRRVSVGVGAGRTIALDELLSPRLSLTDAGWITDGPEAVDAVVTTFRWGGNTLTVFGPGASEGALAFPLPRSLADYGPRPGVELLRDVRVMRFGELDPRFDGPRAANLLLTTEPSWLAATSVASSSAP